MSLGLNTVKENLYWVKSTHDACIAGISIGIGLYSYYSAFLKF